MAVVAATLAAGSRTGSTSSTEMAAGPAHAVPCDRRTPADPGARFAPHRPLAKWTASHQEILTIMRKFVFYTTVSWYSIV
jgi:hypothetical protein